ncbi:cation:proton antiporter [Pseudomonas batumici]|uniref:cation:proton antiporter n=1 Tax=Pseudomonas batumici TaxID=226910 RepID=UPI0030CD51AB
MSHWMIQLFLILIVSGLLGQLAKKMGQSQVIGEITAGLLLGQSVLGAFSPEIFSALFYNEALSNLKVLSELGLIFITFEIAWHTSYKGQAGKALIAKSTPLTITLFGTLSSFMTGCSIAILAKDNMAPDQPFWPYTLFCGLAFSVTALPVLIRIIADSKKPIHTSASYALSSAIYSDIIAWLGVALLVALHSATEKNLVDSLIKTFILAAFFCCSFYVVRPLISYLHRICIKVKNENIQVSVALCYCLISSEITAKLGFHQAIGAVISAYVFCKIPELEAHWNIVIGRFTKAILAPLFFAYSGLQVSFGFLSESAAWVWLFIFITGSSLSKIGGTYIGSRACGIPHKTAIDVGILMNTKGLAEIIMINIGLELGALSQSTYSVLLILAILSTAMTTPLLNISHGYFLQKNRRELTSNLKVKN